MVATQQICFSGSNLVKHEVHPGFGLSYGSLVEGAMCRCSSCPAPSMLLDQHRRELLRIVGDDQCLGGLVG